MRRHNEGTIYYRADRRAKVAAVILPGGRRATAMCPHRDHGKRDRDCAESRALLESLIGQRDVGRGDPRRIRLGPYLQGWITSRMDPRLSHATRRQHEMIVRRHLVPNLGRFTLAELGPSDVDAYLGRPDLDAQTLRHHRATLRRALQDALRDGLVDRNVAALAKAPKVDRRERTVLDAAQGRALIEGTRGTRLHALWTLALTTGLRSAEMLGLAWSEVDLDVPQLRVTSTLHRIDGQWRTAKPKTDKSLRTVPLTAVAVAALREHRRMQLEDQARLGAMGREGLVFTTSKGQPLHGPNLSKLLYAELDRLGLPRVGVHDLRHSCATILYAQGVPLPTIADILGHSTDRITSALYRHRVHDLQVAAAKAMQEAIG